MFSNMLHYTMYKIASNFLCGICPNLKLEKKFLPIHQFNNLILKNDGENCFKNIYERK